VITLTVNEG